MRSIYLAPLSIFAVGVGLIATSMASDFQVSLFGLTLMAPVVRGLGLIAFVFSIVAFMAVYGNTLPPRPQELRRGGGAQPTAHEKTAKPHKVAQEA
ncbi:MAG: hypothetical protein FJ147_23545 [Deltaproteobacteria bacterium]|nr:hypothetical protein [Deltaproteobacteria bacterium]